MWLLCLCLCLYLCLCPCQFPTFMYIVALQHHGKYKYTKCCQRKHIPAHNTPHIIRMLRSNNSAEKICSSIFYHFQILRFGHKNTKISKLTEYGRNMLEQIKYKPCESAILFISHLNPSVTLSIECIYLYLSLSLFSFSLLPLPVSPQNEQKIE